MARHFLNKGLDTDSSYQLVDPSQMINGMNLRVTPKNMLEGIYGTVSRGGPATPGNNECIGARADESGRYIVYFLCNDANAHGIYVYDAKTLSTYVVTQGAYLNFNRYRLIECEIINDILYFSDGYNEPRRVNLGAALLANNITSPISSKWQFTVLNDPYEITLVRRPPNMAPVIVMENDGLANANRISDETFQFCTQFIYWDGEASVLSARSASSRLNLPSESYNRISVSMPIEDVIKDSVRIVRLIVRVGSTGKFFVIKEWDKVKDAAEIAGHNTGVPLTYKFYNNLMGEAISDAEAVTPFHSVPLRSLAMAAVKNRIFLGNNLEGYDTPTKTSLTMLPQTAILADLDKVVKNKYSVLQVFANSGNPPEQAYFNYQATWVEIILADGYLLPGWYAIKYPNTVSIWTDGSTPAPPALVPPVDVAYTGLTFLGTTMLAAIEAIKPDYMKVGGTVASGSNHVTLNSTINITGTTKQAARVFKQQAKYQGGVVFFDRAMRKCGVVTNDTSNVNFRIEEYQEFGRIAEAIVWNLANINAGQEIPEWAYYYAPVMTKDLRTRTYIQGFDPDIQYVSKNADGEYVYTPVTEQVANMVGIAIDLGSLIKQGQGYNFHEGDMCRIFFHAANAYTQEFPVMGVDGNNVILRRDKKIDSFSDVNQSFTFEIYTPYTAAEQERFYEMGQVCRVTNPGSNLRQYETLTGSFAPDSYILTRNYKGATYWAESPSPSESHPNRAATDHGRDTVVTNLGQTWNRTSCRFSGVYVPGTQLNNLSNFAALDEEILPYEMTAIRKLISASRAQSDGNVLLAIGETETASIYIGEGSISTASGSQFLIKTMNVIGQITVLQGSMGTINPESVARFMGRIFWFDALNGVVASYSANGLFPVSNYGVRNATKKLAAGYLTLLGKAQEDTRPFVFGGIDPFYGEYLMSVPLTNEVALAGGRPAPDIFDFADGWEKTWIYRYDRDQWHTPHGYVAEMFCFLGNKLYSFKAGVLHEHGDPVKYNTFYDTNPQDSVIVIADNGEPDNQVKVFTNLAVDANQRPYDTQIITEVPNRQVSDLKDEWVSKEGKHYASILRDRQSPNTTGDANYRLYFGDEMRGQWAKIAMSFAVNLSGELPQIRFVDVISNIAKGHNF